MSCAELCSCCSGLRNASKDMCLWDSVPKLLCAAEQAPTRSHPFHSVGELAGGGSVALAVAIGTSDM